MSKIESLFWAGHRFQSNAPEQVADDNTRPQEVVFRHPTLIQMSAIVAMRGCTLERELHSRWRKQWTNTDETNGQNTSKCRSNKSNILGACHQKSQLKHWPNQARGQTKESQGDFKGKAAYAREPHCRETVSIQLTRLKWSDWFGGKDQTQEELNGLGDPDQQESPEAEVVNGRSRIQQAPF